MAYIGTANHSTPTMRAAPAAPGDGSIEFGEIFRILRARWKWIAGTTILLMGLAVTYGMLTPSLYTATTQIIVDPRDRQVVNNDVNPSALSPDGGIIQVESQASVVQSTGVLLAVIRKLNLTRDPDFNRPGLLDQILGRGNETPTGAFGQPLPSANETRALNTLRRMLSVQRPDKLLVIDVSITARSADKAALIANAIADAYMEDQTEARAQAARGASESLTARLDGLRERVKQAEDAVERYKADHNIVVATGQIVDQQQVTDLNRELTQARNRTTVLKARIDQINQQRRSGLSIDSITEATQSPVIAGLREQEGALVQSQAALASKVGPRHPQLTAVQSQLQQVRQLIAAELGRIVKGAEADYQRALDNERVLAAKLEAMKDQSLSNDRTYVQLRELEREAESVRTVYANYLMRAQETREQIDVDTSNVRVITPAVPPLKRSWPSLSLLLAGSMLAGLGLGTGSALVREYMSPSSIERAAASGTTEIPVIAVLPAGGGYQALPARGGSRRTPLPDESRRSEAIASGVLDDLFEGRSGKSGRMPARSLLVTSAAVDAAERDRVVLLLASVAAAAGDSVLMIDADADTGLRAASVGLQDVLRGESRIDAALRFEASGRLAMMGAGEPGQPRRNADAGTRAAHMLDEAGRRFDLIIVNGGTATKDSAAAPLIAPVDHVLLVGRTGAGMQRNFDTANQALSAMGRAASAAILVDPSARAA